MAIYEQLLTGQQVIMASRFLAFFILYYLVAILRFARNKRRTIVRVFEI